MRRSLRSTLCLTLQFDLSAVPDAAAQQHAKDHAAACEAACVASGICAPSEASARAETTHGAADLAAARALPFDDEGPARHVRLLFLYSAAAPQLCVRVTVALPHLDGVSGLRLALHTLEALEGAAVCAGAAFKTNPSFEYTARHAARTLALAAGTGAAAAWAWLCSPVARPADAAVPRTPAGLYAYYRAPAPPLARFSCYAPRGASPQEAYKMLLAAAQQWHDATGRRGFFNLINLPPHVMPSIVPRAEDMRSMERRYEGVLLPPAPPPMGPAWIIANHVHISGALLVPVSFACFLLAPVVSCSCSFGANLHRRSVVRQQLRPPRPHLQSCAHCFPVGLAGHGSTHRWLWLCHHQRRFPGVGARHARGHGRVQGHLRGGAGRCGWPTPADRLAASCEHTQSSQARLMD